MLFLVRVMQGKIFFYKENIEKNVVMLRLSRIFWGICRLKANPQDLPKGQYLLFAVVFASIIVDSFSSSILIVRLSHIEIVQTVTFYNFILLTSAYLLLKLLGYAERGVQTITAMAGSGLFISLVLLPALLILDTTEDSVKPFTLLILIDNVWRIIVNAHIFRHALSIGLLMAMIISVSYLLFSALVADFLLPAQAA